MRKIIVGTVVSLLTVIFTLPLFAADDPAIPQAIKDRAKQAMQDYIEREVEVKGKFYLPDDVSGKILALDFGYVHSGVVKADGGYLACVDFRAGNNVYDVDFIVQEEDGKFEVEKAVVHAVNKVKRPDHLEGILEHKGSGSQHEHKGSY